LPAPPPGETREFICFEPLAAIISGVNLAQKGRYFELQTVPAADFSALYFCGRESIYKLKTKVKSFIPYVVYAK
jgi:hypothetical protein